MASSICSGTDISFGSVSSHAQSRTIIGSILLATDQQLRVKQLSVRASPDLVYGLGLSSVRDSHPRPLHTHRRIQVDEYGARHIFAIAGFREKRLVGATLGNILGLRVGTSVCLEAVLEQIPSRGWC